MISLCFHLCSFTSWCRSLRCKFMGFNPPTPPLPVVYLVCILLLFFLSLSYYCFFRRLFMASGWKIFTGGSLSSSCVLEIQDRRLLGFFHKKKKYCSAWYMNFTNSRLILLSSLPPQKNFSEYISKMSQLPKILTEKSIIFFLINEIMIIETIWMNEKLFVFFKQKEEKSFFLSAVVFFFFLIIVIRAVFAWKDRTTVSCC